MSALIAIYDFEIFPYALGDVLTWNVRTAMRAEEMGLSKVDIYISLDRRYPAGVFQRAYITEDNFELFFSELFTAFGTHPCLGNIYVFRDRDELLARLSTAVVEDPVSSEGVAEYLNVLEISEKNKARRGVFNELRNKTTLREVLKKILPRKAKELIYQLAAPHEQALVDYFNKYIASHIEINRFAADRGAIPLLKGALGCEVDVDEFVMRRLEGKKVVPFHLRLRRLDAGFGGEESYDRDSDFFEWFDFLRAAAWRYPDVMFVALGRLQEKPLELLTLPNVLSLRTFGMGLGHELTLMNRSDLFIGSSSGFAAYANFSEMPYFITKMNPGACRAYEIPEGSEKLPFAFPKQELIYEKETSEVLMALLERGLELVPLSRDERVPAMVPDTGAGMVDIQAWRNARLQPSNPAATTCRFRSDRNYREAETGFLLEPVFARIVALQMEGRGEEARSLLMRVRSNFPDLCPRLPEFVAVSDKIPR